jgi:hypothetical protein
MNQSQLRLEILKLENKALRAFPSSPIQKKLQAEIRALRKKLKGPLMTDSFSKKCGIKINPKPIGSNIPIGTTFLYKNVYITKNPGGYRVRGIVGYEFYYLADAKKNISSWLKSGRYVIHNNAIVTKPAKRNPSGLIYRGIKITKRDNKYYYGVGVPYAFRVQAELKDYIDDKLDRGRAVVSARQGLILV